jgi:hypothetical protein
MSINFGAGTSGLTFLARDCPGRVGLGLGLGAERVLDAAAPAQRFSIPCRERHFFIDNLLVRIHYFIVMTK